jgi:hypothetical protein
VTASAFVINSSPSASVIDSDDKLELVFEEEEEDEDEEGSCDFFFFDPLKRDNTR